MQVLWYEYCNSLACDFNPFVPNASFLYPWKQQKTVSFCCFLGVEKGCTGNEWVKENTLLTLSFSRNLVAHRMHLIPKINPLGGWFTFIKNLQVKYLFEIHRTYLKQNFIKALSKYPKMFINCFPHSINNTPLRPTSIFSVSLTWRHLSCDFTLDGLELQSTAYQKKGKGNETAIQLKN